MPSIHTIQGGGRMLTITAAACENFKQILKENPGKSVRVVFEGFG
jgi:hypothetical protein